jgi:hypothetical protein
MLTRVSVQNRLGKTHNITIKCLVSGHVSCLPVPRGVASIASQILASGHEAILAEGAGFEVVFAKHNGVPLLSLHRHTKLGAQRVATLRVHKHTLLYSHTAVDYKVVGLERLGAHLVSRSHVFEKGASEPLSVSTRLISDLELQFANSSPANVRMLHSIGTVVLKCHHCQGPIETRNVLEPCTCCATNKETLCVACTGAGPHHECKNTGDSIVLGSGGVCSCCGNALPEAGVDQTQFTVHTCCGVDKYKSLFMYNSNVVSRLSSLQPDLGVAHARGVCLNLVLAHGMRGAPEAVLLAETLQQAPVTEATGNTLRAVRSQKPCTTLQYRDSSGQKQTVLMYKGPEEVCAYVLFSAHDTPVLVGATGLEPLKGRPMPFSKLREAVGEMVFLHHESSTNRALRGCRYALKAACFTKYAGGLEPENRSILLALCNEDSPGFYGLASEMVYAADSRH